MRRNWTDDLNLTFFFLHRFVIQFCCFDIEIMGGRNRRTGMRNHINDGKNVWMMCCDLVVPRRQISISSMKRKKVIIIMLWFAFILWSRGLQCQQHAWMWLIFVVWLNQIVVFMNANVSNDIFHSVMPNICHCCDSTNEMRKCYWTECEITACARDILCECGIYALLLL